MRALIKTGFTLLVLALVLIAVGYTALRVNGISAPRSQEGRAVATEQRDVTAEVTNVEVSGPFTLSLRRGDAPSLSVKGEKRLLANLEARQEGSRLSIGMTGMVLHHRRPIEIELVLPKLENVEVSGSGHYEVSGFGGERVAIHKRGSGVFGFNGLYADVTVSTQGSGSADINAGKPQRMSVEMVGSGSTTIVGSCRELQAEHAGSGELDMRDLAAERATVEQRGSGSTSITATREAALTLSGSGSMEVYGMPAKRSVARNGSGTIVFKD